MNCPHLKDTICYAIEPFTPTQEICRACTRLGQGINQVTTMACIEQLLKDNQPVPDYLWDFMKKTTTCTVRGKAEDPLARGPGTNLKWLLSWFVTQPPNCSCADRAKLMNLWGKEKCLQELPTILGWLRESALDNNITYSEFVVSLIVKFSCRISSRISS